VVRGEQIVISAVCWIDALRCLDPLTETVDKRSAVKVHLVRSAPLEEFPTADVPPSSSVSAATA
jgi:hypothetical protein